jgi:ABC-type bacteriocin/lantibiotic exporter with double-glycine peptidase domain
MGGGCWKVKAGLTPCGGDAVPPLDTPALTRPDGYSCGATCLEVLFRFHGVRFPAAYRELSSPEVGMAPETVEAVLRAAFPNVVVARGTVELLRGLTAYTPVLCHAVVGGVDHWVVVRGVARGRVYVHCPARGRGAYPAGEWAAMWADTAGHYPRYAAAGWPG